MQLRGRGSIHGPEVLLWTLRILGPLSPLSDLVSRWFCARRDKTRGRQADATIPPPSFQLLEWEITKRESLAFVSPPLGPEPWFRDSAWEEKQAVKEILASNLFTKKLTSFATDSEVQLYSYSQEPYCGARPLRGHSRYKLTGGCVVFLRTME